MNSMKKFAVYALTAATMAACTSRNHPIAQEVTSQPTIDSIIEVEPEIKESPKPDATPKTFQWNFEFEEKGKEYLLQEVVEGEKSYFRLLSQGDSIYEEYFDEGRDTTLLGDNDFYQSSLGPSGEGASPDYFFLSKDRLSWTNHTRNINQDYDLASADSAIVSRAENALQSRNSDYQNLFQAGVESILSADEDSVLKYLSSVREWEFGDGGEIRSADTGRAMPYIGFIDSNQDGKLRWEDGDSFTVGFGESSSNVYIANNAFYSSTNKSLLYHAMKERYSDFMNTTLDSIYAHLKNDFDAENTKALDEFLENGF